MNATLEHFAIAALAAVLAAPFFAQAGEPVASCDSLAKVVLPDATITLVKSYAGGELAFPQEKGGRTPLPALPALCRVQATIVSSKEVEVKAEVWLPLKNWNGNLVGATYPGRPTVQHGELIEGVRQGYAAVMIDGPAMDRWELIGASDEKLIDYGYRGLHKITVAGKEMVRAFYGKEAKHSFFLGCSEGGREGLSEAHHFPGDYDGISVGGAGHVFALINAAHLYPAWLALKNPGYALTAEKWKMVHETVIKGCDEIDGVKDGVIENPADCHYDFNQLACKGAEAAVCLTAPQIEFLSLIYKGATNPRTKKVFFEPPALGAELKIIEFALPDKPTPYKLYQDIVFGNDPSWNLLKMDMDKDIEKAIQKLGPALHTEPKDLKAFFARGGKLIVWDGWNDYNGPYHWMRFGKDVEKLYGRKTADASLRLYFSPGMDHCAGGPGCDTFDKLGSIASWVETGKAPAFLVAAHYEGEKVTRTHPMCAYPTVAKYKGTGDTNEAANWACTKPATKK